MSDLDETREVLRNLCTEMTQDFVSRIPGPEEQEMVFGVYYFRDHEDVEEAEKFFEDQMLPHYFDDYFEAIFQSMKMGDGGVGIFYVMPADTKGYRGKELGTFTLERG